MHVDRIPNWSSPPAYLLRGTYREGRKVRKRTLANITHWPVAKIEALRRVLRGDLLGGDAGRGLSLLRSLPHGHVAAALGMLRKLGLDRVLSQGGRQPARWMALSIAMIVARLIDPSKLATARLLDGATASCSLGAVLELAAVDEQELYDALDWLMGQQEPIEKALAHRHLKNGILVLYGVTSTYFEGRTCRLPSSATIATPAFAGGSWRASCGSCSGFCAPERVARSWWKCSKAMSAIHRRCSTRSTSSRPAWRSTAW